MGKQERFAPKCTILGQGNQLSLKKCRRIKLTLNDENSSKSENVTKQIKRLNKTETV